MSAFPLHTKKAELGDREVKSIPAKLHLIYPPSLEISHRSMPNSDCSKKEDLFVKLSFSFALYELRWICAHFKYFKRSTYISAFEVLERGDFHFWPISNLLNDLSFVVQVKFFKQLQEAEPFSKSKQILFQSRNFSHTVQYEGYYLVQNSPPYISVYWARLIQSTFLSFILMSSF